jgi:hypothetical protein
MLPEGSKAMTGLTPDPEDAENQGNGADNLANPTHSPKTIPVAAAAAVDRSAVTQRPGADEKMPSGHLALGSADLISEIRRILAAHHHWWTGARPPGVDHAAHAPPDMPMRELGRVGPPVWNVLVRGSQRLRRLLLLHRTLLVRPGSLRYSIEQISTEQNRYST